jgi:hypothetical protein
MGQGRRKTEDCRTYNEEKKKTRYDGHASANTAAVSHRPKTCREMGQGRRKTEDCRTPDEKKKKKKNLATVE